MMGTELRWRALRRGGTAFALGSVVGFAAIILRSPIAGPGLHEVAGAVILGAIVVALVGAAKTRRSEPRPWARLWAALAVLVMVGGLGGSLEISALPPGFAYAPLLGLGVLAVILLDALRNGSPRASRPMGAGPPASSRPAPFDGSINEGSAGAPQDVDRVRP